MVLTVRVLKRWWSRKVAEHMVIPVRKYVFYATIAGEIQKGILISSLHPDTAKMKIKEALREGKELDGMLLLEAAQK